MINGTSNKIDFQNSRRPGLDEVMGVEWMSSDPRDYAINGKDSIYRNPTSILHRPGSKSESESESESESISESESESESESGSRHPQTGQNVRRINDYPLHLIGL